LTVVKSGSVLDFQEPASEPDLRASVYLTFDDGPDAEWTPRVLDVLAKAGARATFFVVGRAVHAAPALLRRIAADGHEIGNHTYGHRHPWTMRESEARREVRDGAAAIADTLGRAPCGFRPPHGRARRCMVEEAALSGQRTVLWSLSAIDWGPLGHASSIAARLNKVGPCDVVLMHDGRCRHNRPDQMLQVLPGLLARLDERRLAPAVIAGWSLAASDDQADLDLSAEAAARRVL
jgi:peptidoglycan/xylan/chitin deacetylase (PgdA/CDA1 family)